MSRLMGDDDDDDDDDDDLDEALLVKTLKKDKLAKKCKGMYAMMKKKLMGKDDDDDDSTDGAGTGGDSDRLSDGDVQVMKLILKATFKGVSGLKTWTEISAKLVTQRKPSLLKMLEQLEHSNCKKFSKKIANTTKEVLTEAVVKTLKKKVLETKD
jgi:hypothetical protein